MSAKPRIILFDLETLPNLSKVIKYFPEFNTDRYGMTLKADVNSIICFGYKVYGEATTYCNAVWDTPRGKKDMNDDKDLLKIISDVLSSADAIVTHNGTNFDLKMVNTRLIMAGMPPLPRMLHIDTCMVAKSNLYFLRNRLNHLAEELSTEKKMKHDGWVMWENLANARYTPLAFSIARDRNRMVRYNKKDVIVLEKILDKLKPFIKNIPNRNLFDKGGYECPKCGSSNVQKRGQSVTLTKRHDRYHCQDCGSWSTNKQKKTVRLEAL